MLALPSLTGELRVNGDVECSSVRAPHPHAAEAVSKADQIREVSPSVARLCVCM